MTDLDQLARTVKDLEYRVKALEKAREPSAVVKNIAIRHDKAAVTWCSCGRDLCRAPDCPSHKG